MGYYVDSQNITLLYSEWLGRMNITILLVEKTFLCVFIMAVDHLSFISNKNFKPRQKSIHR